MNAPPKVKRKERTAVIQSLRAGVVPKLGLHHIQVGRKKEIEALLSDFEIVGDGGAAIRFVVGRFGSGKTFLLNLAANVAHEQGFLVAGADITTERRLQGSGGQPRALFSELAKNLSSKARPDGNALTSVIDRFLHEEAEKVGHDDEQLRKAVSARLAPLRDMVFGFDFTAVLLKYYEGFQAGNDELAGAAVRWLRGEYSTKTEARSDLGVRSIIDDSNIYDAIKLLARFSRLAGYKGLIVSIDELVVLSHRLASSRARLANYEMILRILNDCLQGHVEGLMFLFGGTDECLEDRRRGLFSYEALATRLAPNEFASEKRVDFSGPVLRLSQLSAEDLYVLLFRIRDVFANGDPSKHLVPDEALSRFLDYSTRNLGEASFQTSRDVVTRFVDLLSILESDPTAKWQEVLGAPAPPAAPRALESIPSPAPSVDAETPASDDAEALVKFRL